jgi:hypothetical protein
MFAVFLALWPAGVLKLSALKGYIVLCGLYGGSEWETPLRVVLRDFFCESPVLMVFCLVGLVLGVHRVFSRKAPGWILPLVLFPTVIFISNLRNAIAKPAYLALIVPCLALLAGWALWTVAERTVRRPVILLAAVMVVCAAVNGPRLLAAGVHGLYIWPQVIQFFDERANAGDSVLVSNNIESKVLAHYEPKLAVCHGHRWALALQQTTERILRGDYRFLMLIGYPARSDPGRPYEKPVSDLPYYNIVKDRYDLVEVLKRGPDDVIVELYERRKSR